MIVCDAVFAVIKIFCVILFVLSYRLFSDERHEVGLRRLYGIINLLCSVCVLLARQ